MEQERLTTTRVAQRAGVSVGTLYQYYPNKRSLLFAVLENHLNKVAARVEAACESARHKPLAEMTKEMVDAFVDAKLERADISVALYRISTEVGGPALVKRVGQRSRKAVEAMNKVYFIQNILGADQLLSMSTAQSFASYQNRAIRILRIHGRTKLTISATQLR